MSQSISGVLRRFVAIGSNARPGQARARVITPDQDRFLMVIRMRTPRQRFVTSTLLQNEFLESYNVRISQNTVRRNLAEADIRLRSAAPGYLLTSTEGNYFGSTLTRTWKIGLEYYSHMNQDILFTRE